MIPRAAELMSVAKNWRQRERRASENPLDIVCTRTRLSFVQKFHTTSRMLIEQCCRDNGHGRHFSTAGRSWKVFSWLARKMHRWKRKWRKRRSIVPASNASRCGVSCASSPAKSLIIFRQLSLLYSIWGFQLKSFCMRASYLHNGDQGEETLAVALIFCPPTG